MGINEVEMSVEDWTDGKPSEMSTKTLALRVWLFAHMCADKKRTAGVESEIYKELSEVLTQSFTELNNREVEDIANGWRSWIELGIIDYDKLVRIYNISETKIEN